MITKGRNVTNNAVMRNRLIVPEVCRMDGRKRRQIFSRFQDILATGFRSASMLQPASALFVGGHEYIFVNIWRLGIGKKKYYERTKSLQDLPRLR